MGKDIIYCPVKKGKVNKQWYCPDYTCDQCPGLEKKKLEESKKETKKKAPSEHCKKDKKRQPLQTLSLYDRLQALKRLDQYRKDYARYKEKHLTSSDLDIVIFSPYIEPHLSKEAKWLCQKYDIPFPFDPDLEISEDSISFPPNPYQKQEINKEVPKIRLDKIRSSYYSNPVIPVDPYPTPKISPAIINNRYLFLLVDLKQPQKTLESAFKEVIKELKGYNSIASILKKEKKQRPFIVDKWKVYDLTLEGKNLSQITKELYNKKELSPAYSKEDMSLYLQVKRAFQKAKTIIEAVSKSY